MSQEWYYVDGNERIGPVTKSELQGFFNSGKLEDESYVWTNGFDNWKLYKDVEELNESEPETGDIPAPPFPFSNTDFDWHQVDLDARIFSIRVGVDRQGEAKEYGPYSINRLKEFFEENRISGKTLLFTPGMSGWEFLSEIPIFDSVFSGIPPVIEDDDRRATERKPFLARIFFHDQMQVFEGICRDISVGGLQVLVADFTGKVGEKVSMNVHPENTDCCFVASGKIVRLLDGNQGFSLRFDNLGDDAKKAILDYVNYA